MFGYKKFVLLYHDLDFRCCCANESEKGTNSNAHTTDAEVKANLIPIQSIFEYMGWPLQQPTKMFCDNRAVFSIVDLKRMTPRCRHFDIPIAFLHAHKNTVYAPELITTDRMLADIGTKPNTPAVFKRFKYWITGV